MEISNAFIAIIGAIFILYYFLYKHPIRWVRISGCLAIILVSIGLVAVEDTVPMFILFSANLMVCGLKFIMEVGSIAEVIKKR